MKLIHSRLFNFLFLLIAFILSLYASLKLVSPNVQVEDIWGILPISFLIFFIAIIITEADRPKLYQKRFKYVFSPFLKFVLLIGCLFLLLAIPFFSQINNFFYWVFIHIIGSSITVTLYALLLYPSLKLSKSNFIISSEVTKYSQKQLTDLDSTDDEDGIAYKNGDDGHFTKQSQLADILNVNFPQLSFERVDLTDKSSLNIKLLVIDRALNNIHDLNKLLSDAHLSLKNGGKIVAVYKELKDFEYEYTESMYSVVQKFKKVYFVLRYRLLHKIPYLNFLVRRGSTMYSKAEIWGRLAYAGFDVKKDVPYSGLRYILASKDFEISKNPSPSFYPVISLNRVGLYGQIIKIHKIRSMSPYSEFIQKKVHDENQLSGTGKFVNDFRITEFGAFFRRYWLDELPQIYDWFRGEIKLVGIRALSQHYFSLYPPDFQEKFIRVKPGIISPIFDEETDGFEEIIRIETEYLDSYLRHPVLTDIKYFFITFRQILSGVRSK